MVAGAKGSTGRSNAAAPKAKKKELVAVNKSPPAKKFIDDALLSRAMTALLKYHEETAGRKSGKGTKQLLGSDLTVQVQIGLSRVPQNPSPKPIRIAIPHPLHRVAESGGEENKVDDGDSSVEEAEVCIIVKEESKPWVQDMIDRFPSHMSCVKKVLGLQSLRKKHAQYEQRRELMARYSVFMVDDRILPMVAKCLGKGFFTAKKQPIPLKLTRKEALPFAVQRCLSATYLFISAGTCLTIRAGDTGMSHKKLVENTEAIVASAVDKVPRKWANVSSISIKTTDSISLPFYNKTPQELADIAKLAGLDHANEQLSKKRSRGNDIVGEADPIEEEEQSKEERIREIKAKSPLVQALKKQKQEENKEDVAEKPKSSKKKKKRRAVEEGGGGESKGKDKAVAGDKSAKKLKTPSKKSETDDPAPQTTGNSTANEKKKPQKASTESTVAGGQTGGTIKDTTPSKKEEKMFVKSRHFKGAKKGYVFRKGVEGVGYYVDIKPVPDQMAMEALNRFATPGHASRKKTPKSKSKRRGRR